MNRSVAKIHQILLKKKKTIAVAESCTGGLVSKLLTDLPKSSKYFLLGVISYSNSAKTSVLKVSAKIIRERGAVSAQVAAEMAESVRRLGKTDFGISITGIAGPGGGSKDKPVGTVFCAVADKSKTVIEEFNFSGSRGSIRRQSSQKALELLKTLI